MEASQYRYTISQTKKINKLLKKEIGDILEKIAQDVTNKVKVYIRQYWYYNYSPLDYERTFSLLEAVSYQIDRTNQEVYIYIDEQKLIYNVQSGWGQHIGFDGNKFSEGLIEFVENGIFDSGRTGSQNNPKIGKGSFAIQRTIKWLNKYLKNKITSELKLRFGNNVIW